MWNLEEVRRTGRVGGGIVTAALLAVAFTQGAQARLSSNGMAINGMAINRIVLNRIVLNKISLNGAAGHRIALNGPATGAAAAENPFLGLDQEAIAR